MKFLFKALKGKIIDVEKAEHRGWPLRIAYGPA